LRGVIIANYATTAALAAGTYSNGTLGVGATFTITAHGALAAIDGQTPAANDIVLVKDQASGLQNGIYTVTTLGDAGTSAVLTRITAADTAAKIAGCNVAVALGTANANSAWTINLAAASITVGTTALTFANPHTSATAPADIAYPATVGTSPHLTRRDHMHQRGRSAATFGFRCDFSAPNTANFVSAVLYVGTMGEVGWVATNANAATGLTIGTNTATEVGLLLLSTGANTAGSCTAISGSTAPSGTSVTPTSGNPMWFEVKFALADAVSGAVDSYKIIVGLSDTLNGAPANGFWAEVDANADTHILVKTCSGGAGNVVTAVTSTVVMGTATYHIFRVTKAAGTTTCNIYIDDMVNPVGTGTMPTNIMWPCLEITKSAGTNARRLEVDWFDMDYSWATPRT
jgi:hypothetical protein